LSEVVSSLSVESVKRYCKLDYDDETVQELIEEAEEYVIDATHPNVDTSKKAYALAVKMRVAHNNDNRGVVDEKPVPTGFQKLLIKLKLSSEDVVDADLGT